MNNIWGFENVNDFIYTLFNDGKDKYTVLLITNEDNAEITKSNVKKHFKQLSKIYPCVNFFYYDVKNDDYGEINPIFEKNDNKPFPRLYHVYDSTKIIGEHYFVHNKHIIDLSFNDDLKEAYTNKQYCDLVIKNTKNAT